jgi:GntR family transcriptional regulator
MARGRFVGMQDLTPSGYVKLDRGESTDLHEQVAAEIRRAIAEGEAGETPSCGRSGTYATKGSSTSAAGRGVTVTGSQPQGAVHAQARELVELARRHGYRRDELIRLIETLP